MSEGSPLGSGSKMRLAINGYGRIGRCVLRAIAESHHRERFEVVAINEPADLATIAHLTKYDSTHGRYPGRVEMAEGELCIDGYSIAVSHRDSPDDLPWKSLAIDTVLDCSGRFDRLGLLNGHLMSGAKRVLLSQPGEPSIPTYVYGVNHHQIDTEAEIISAASCTSNCVVPVINVLHREFGVEQGLITTIHSAMNDQPVLDAYHHTDLRKTRAASQSIIPVDTGLAAGIDRLLPELAGRFSARALRVPTTNVSAMELSVRLNGSVDAESVNSALRAAAGDDLIAVLGVSDEPLASCDYNHDPRSVIVDAAQTRVSGDLVSVLLWFDNEWGFANRMLDILAHWTGTE